MAKNEDRPFIYNIDILSGTPELLISRNKNYSTLFGLITTFIILFIGVTYSIYSLYIFFFEREVTVVELNDNFMNTNFNISTKDFLLAFNVFNVSMKLQYYWGKEVDLSSGKDISKKVLDNIYTVKLYYENPETKTIINEHYLKTEYCEIGKNINKNIIDKYNFTDYQNYLCISDKENVEFVINKTHNTYIDIIIAIDLNRNEGINKQIINDDKSSVLVAINYLEFQMYIPNDIISNRNLTNPINFRKNYYYSELLSPGSLERNEIVIKSINYLSDNGMIFKNEEKFNGFSIESSIKTKNQNMQSFDLIQNITYNEFRLYFNADEISSYQRTYRKLPENIADITGVVSLLINVGKIIVGFLLKYYLEAETMSQVLQSKLFVNTKIKLKKKNDIGLKNNMVDSKSSHIECSKFLIDDSNQKNVIINNENNNNDIIKNVNNITDKNNKLSLINNNISKNKIENKNDFSLKEKNEIISENEYNKIDNHLYKDNKDNKNNIHKKNTVKINSKYYSHALSKILGVNPHESQNKINLHSFSFCDYICYRLKKNNIKTKMIDKLSIFLENILSVEEIIRRAIDLEIIISVIQSKFRKEFNLADHMAIWMKKDNELKKLLEDENKKINID